MTNWELFSRIIEMVGILTVIVTLIYLAIQVRLNSKQLDRTFQSTKTQNWQSISKNFNTWREMVLSSDNADIWIRGINNLDELNRTDHIRFNMMASSFVWTCWQYYHLLQNEGLFINANDSLFKDLYKHEGFRSWLFTHEKYHTDDFGKFLESVRNKVGADRYKIGESSSLTDGIY